MAVPGFLFSTDNCFQRMTQFLINVTPNGRVAATTLIFIPRLRVNLVAIGRGYVNGVFAWTFGKNNEWPLGIRVVRGWRGSRFEILRSLCTTTGPRRYSPPLGYRFLLVFHSVPPKNHKFHSSFFFSHSLSLYIFLSLSSCIFSINT